MLTASWLNNSSSASFHLYSLKSWERRSATSFVVITASSVGIINDLNIKNTRLTCQAGDAEATMFSKNEELNNYKPGNFRDEGSFAAYQEKFPPLKPALLLLLIIFSGCYVS